MFSNGRWIPPRKRTAYRAHEVCFLELYFSILERFLNILHKNKFLWFLSCNPHTSELELQLKKTSILTKNFEFFFEKRFLWSIFASNQQSKQTHLVKNDNVMATNIFIIFLPIHPHPQKHQSCRYVSQTEIWLKFGIFWAYFWENVSR